MSRNVINANQKREQEWESECVERMKISGSCPPVLVNERMERQKKNNPSRKTTEGKKERLKHRKSQSNKTKSAHKFHMYAAFFQLFHCCDQIYAYTQHLPSSHPFITLVATTELSTFILSVSSCACKLSSNRRILSIFKFNELYKNGHFQLIRISFNATIWRQP